MHRHTLLLALALPVVLGGCAASLHSTTDDKPASYHYQMGLAYLGEHNYTAALRELLEIEKHNASDAELQYNLGVAYMGKRRPDLAVPRFLKAISLKHNYSVAHNDLGVVYMDLKQWDKAIQEFRLVKNDLLYPQHNNAVINLGLAYLGKGDYPKAMEELDSVRTDDPSNPTIRVTIGRVLAAQGKTSQAIAEYRKALEFYPNYASAHYYLALSLMKVDLVAARSAFREVTRLAPDTELSQSAQEYLELLK